MKAWNRRPVCLLGLWLIGLSTLTVKCVTGIAQEQGLASSSTIVGKSSNDLVAIFAAAHDGWSLDEVLIQDSLRERLVSSYREAGGSLGEAELLEELIALRKSGKLDVKSTKTNRIELDEVSPAAEIAARRIMEESKESLDRVFIDRTLLKRFDELVREVLPGADCYAARKAALRLRKTRRLRPELLARVTDWRVQVQTFVLDDVLKELEMVPKRPGVYIFRDSTGYLYIGQSKDLRERLSHHFKQSDRAALANYLEQERKGVITLELHVFQEWSPAEDTVIREAYESELIRTRQPRLNLAP